MALRQGHVTLAQALRDVFVLPIETRGREPPRFHKLWAFVVGPHFPERAVGCFAEGTITYTLSKTWHDLVTAYCFALNPVPFCTDDYPEDDCAPASSGRKFLYAFWLLPVAALLKYGATDARLQWIPSVDTVPAMVGMLAGWGLGDAFTALFAELREGRLSWVCAPPPYEGAAADCTGLDTTLASVLTLAASLMITHVQPLTRNLQLGDGAILDLLESWIESIWQLVSKARPKPGPEARARARARARALPSSERSTYPPPPSPAPAPAPAPPSPRRSRHR